MTSFTQFNLTLQKWSYLGQVAAETNERLMCHLCEGDTFTDYLFLFQNGLERKGVI